MESGNFNKDGDLQGSIDTDGNGRALWTYTARIRQLIARQVAIKELIIHLLTY